MRLRLLLSFVLVVFVSVVGVVILARWGAAQEVRAFMYRGNMVEVDQLVADLETHYRTYGSWQGVENVLQAWFPERGHGAGGMGQGGMMMNQRLRLANGDGNLLLDSANSAVLGEITQAELDAAIPIVVRGKTVGYLLAEGGMGFNRTDETFLLSRLSRAALTAGLIAGGLALLLGLLLAYRLLNPVQALDKAAERLGLGDFSQRVQVQGNDELANLGRTFNHMAESLEQSRESRRALTADIAHELRTPLAVQRANLEAMQDGVYPLTNESLQPVLEQNLLLTRLVEDLSTLALADSGEIKLEFAQTDLALIVKTVLERFQPQAISRRVSVKLSTESVSHLPAEVDSQRIEQILNNLLSNALRHTNQDGAHATNDRGEILVRIAKQGDRAHISIQDNGAGIPEEALTHVFERFYRVDKARSRTEGGTGLGLAIARHLAQAHGGDLVAANAPSGGAIFTLILPLRINTG